MSLAFVKLYIYDQPNGLKSQLGTKSIFGDTITYQITNNRYGWLTAFIMVFPTFYIF